MHNTRFMKATIDYQSGANLVKTFDDGDTKSGTHLYRSFCSNCGSSLFLRSAAVPGLLVAQCSALDDNEPRKPKFELFEDDRKPWLSKVSTPKL
ncbi:hypothetical protein AMS68_005790 [Peltaster fructicola]|uniref:CENP-V/GFA domain-containing protein n=1 Tax=Peltaster fructicola TaxID=286661 RepID=A0A6H0XZT6_9PEZI|nr:hypothetical protein AMS68_005790 [Peltaster fructicola]